MMAAGGGNHSGLAGEAGFMLGGLDVRPSTREVIGADGSSLLEPRVMQVLVVLARHRGRVVARTDLIAECWAGRVVGDDAINRCIQAIRRLAVVHGGFSILTVARVGYRLDEIDKSEAAAPSSPEHIVPAALGALSASERRHLTLFSCGLVRLSGIGAGVDPELWYAIASEWRQMAIEAVMRFGAHVDTARGDRLLAWFGYPQAQEDAAERAVRAGLEIVERTAALNARADVGFGIDLAARIGIDSGTVVVADGATGGTELFGDTPDVAAQAEAAVALGGIAVTRPVLDQISGLFRVEPIETRTSGDPLHRVLSVGLAGAGRVRETPVFVGRDEEISLVESRWRRVRDGAGQFVLVHGEPGIGKSRLIDAFRRRVEGQPHLWIECRGEPLFANTPLHASTQMLWRGLGWRGDETPTERAAVLERSMRQSKLRLDEAVPLVADMLNLPVPDEYRPLMLAPDQRRRRLLATLSEWLFSAARALPLVLVVEDLHWLDPSSLELLHLLADRGSDVPLLLLCTARPDFRPGWVPRAHHVQIALGGLGRGEMRALVRGLDRIDEGAIESVVDRADGVPLFAEALARLIADDATTTQIPATLLDSLGARLDRLGEAKAIAQRGAVIGRDFNWSMLRAISPEDETILHAGLDRLVDAGLLHVRGAVPDAHYQFRHALIRDAAYGALLGIQRREWHARIARVLAAKDEQSGLLAQHWTEAGERDKAIGAWRKAAVSAEARYAFAEAAHAFRQALAQLVDQAESPERDTQEIELSNALAVLLLHSREDDGSGELQATVARCHELVQRSGNLIALVAQRTYAFTTAMVGGEWARTVLLAEQVGKLVRDDDSEASRIGRTMARAMGHFCASMTAYYAGNLHVAEERYRAWEVIQNDAEWPQQGAAAMAFGNGAQIAAFMGQSALARQRIALGRDFVRSEPNPFHAAFGRMLESLLLIVRRDPEAVEVTALEAVENANHSGLRLVAAWGRACLGWARAHRGAPEEGVSLLRASLTELAHLKSRVSLPFFLTLLGEAQALAGAETDALDTFGEALTVSPYEALYRPYTLICRGELRARRGDRAGAETDFREAIALAEPMGAIAYQLRATNGLARLVPARHLGARIATLISGFADDDQSRDVREARGLIEAMARSST